MKYRIIFIFLFCSCVGYGQIKVKPFKDKSFHAPCWCEMKKYTEDTTQWQLYKIDSGKYFYFALVPYGFRDKYGWDDAVARYEKVYKKEAYILNTSKISDTIPEIMNFEEYDDSCKCFKNWNEWSVGGIWGEIIKISNTTFSKQ